MLDRILWFVVGGIYCVSLLLLALLLKQEGYTWRRR